MPTTFAFLFLLIMAPRLIGWELVADQYAVSSVFVSTSRVGVAGTPGMAAGEIPLSF